MLKEKLRKWFCQNEARQTLLLLGTAKYYATDLIIENGELSYKKGLGGVSFDVAISKVNISHATAHLDGADDFRICNYAHCLIYRRLHGRMKCAP